MTMPGSAINWFEIPVTDLERAIAFYQSILGVTLERMEKDDMKMAMFPVANMESQVTGCLIAWPQAKPSADGARIYLNCQGQLDAVVERIAAAGGTIAMPITPIPPHGRIAMLADTEGNVIGLHAMD